MKEYQKISQLPDAVRHHFKNLAFEYELESSESDDLDLVVGGSVYIIENKRDLSIIEHNHYKPFTEMIYDKILFIDPFVELWVVNNDSGGPSYLVPAELVPLELLRLLGEYINRMEAGNVGF